MLVAKFFLIGTFGALGVVGASRADASSTLVRCGHPTRAPRIEAKQDPDSWVHLTLEGVGVRQFATELGLVDDPEWHGTLTAKIPGCDFSRGDLPLVRCSWIWGNQDHKIEALDQSGNVIGERPISHFHLDIARVGTTVAGSSTSDTDFTYYTSDFGLQIRTHETPSRDARLTHRFSATECVAQ